MCVCVCVCVCTVRVVAPSINCMCATSDLYSFTCTYVLAALVNSIYAVIATRSSDILYTIFL